MCKTDAMRTILGIGGANLDWVAKMGIPGIDGASMPGQARSAVGGCCMNTMRVLAQLCPDEQLAFISARGGDFAGSQVADAIEASGITDQSAVFLDRSTPTYTAVLNHHGDVEAAVADMALYESALPRHLRRREVRQSVAEAELLIIDANLPAETIEQTLQGTHAFKIGLAISAAKAERLTPAAENFDLIFLNRRELRAMTGQDDAEHLRALGFRCAVVSDGPNPITILDEASIAEVSVPAVPTIVDVTGAGDALAAGVIAAHIRSSDTSLADCVRIGIHASAAALQTHGPVPTLDWDTLVSQAKTHER
ncbi:MAG: PfkB family carbohydrate kinase [Pseudomonadota bacterium]